MSVMLLLYCLINYSCSIVTFGKKMCGHKGILHGGASAATLDQFFGLMNCLPPCRGFTGQLSVSYRKIILCPSTVLIRGVVDRVERRKQNLVEVG